MQQNDSLADGYSCRSPPTAGTAHGQPAHSSCSATSCANAPGSVRTQPAAEAAAASSAVALTAASNARSFSSAARVAALCAGSEVGLGSGARRGCRSDRRAAQTAAGS